MKQLAIISGSSNQVLASEISNLLDVSLTKTLTTTFNDGSRRVEVLDNVRDMDVFVIQSVSKTVNDHLMELFLLLDALKRSSCYRVTTVMPCMPYARDDRKIKSRVPIGAKLVADLISTAGTQRFLTAELHAPQIGGFFNIPVDNLHMFKIFIPHIQANHSSQNTCIVAPDAGSIKVAKSYAGKLDCETAMIFKHRTKPGEIAEMKLLGEVKGKDCILIDDMADTCGTLGKAANLLDFYGANSVEAYCTHPVLSGRAFINLRDSCIKKLYVTNTIDNSAVKYSDAVEVLSAAPLFAEAMKGINEERSLAYLFD